MVNKILFINIPFKHGNNVGLPLKADGVLAKDTIKSTEIDPLTPAKKTFTLLYYRDTTRKKILENSYTCTVPLELSMYFF
jgi:hypothetical protein